MVEDSEQRVILLTGASRGIGHATVRKFSEEKWRVITCSRQAFDPKCPWPGGEENHVQVDLSNPNNTLEAIDEVKKRLDGKLHALVNNAGISPKGDDGERLDTLGTDLSIWGKVFHVNFFASVILARGLKEELLRAKGAIVNVTSIAGSRVHPFAGAAYATSKAALGALTREMSKDFGPLGVRVNAIAPGEVKTAILSEGTDKIVADIPMKRLGLPEEVADTIFYLCSEKASYVSGAEIEINGGQHV
ncbi:MAG: SDR family NAD(P)-dependent oxidoreductase [Paracoccaceae bacterium]|jgi:NAD(P)-dependent dehydrogenase (short-subunit alcohol dehydrogenase family)|nr:MAG: SDR family NAD(P)-dependent oxidoreductase [Alphaproteobacteria bacterium]|tara:strand:+ start:617 stop:1357 length:741 start_codon:yes stop_codon:yes gene_type:complete